MPERKHTLRSVVSVIKKINLCQTAEGVVISTDVAVVNTSDVFKLKEMC